MDFSNCPICLESYNQNDNIPMTLLCGHTICRNCIVKLHNGVKIQCPSDRNFDNRSLKDIQPNYLAIKMLEQRNPEQPTSTFCRNHNTVLTSYCRTCKICFCKKCIRAHISHDVFDLEDQEIVEETDKILKCRLVDAEHNFQIAKSSLDKIESIIHNIYQDKSDIAARINMVFDNWINFLQERKKNLLAELENQMQEQSQKLKEEKQFLQGQLELHQMSFTQIQEIVRNFAANKDVAQALESLPVFKTFPISLKKNKIEQLDLIFEFKEDATLQEIVSIGNLRRQYDDEKLIQLYQQRKDIIDQHYNSYKNTEIGERQRFEYANFALLLKMNNLQELADWYILDISAKDILGKKLEDLVTEKNPALIKLSERDKKQIQLPQNFSLSEEEKQTLLRVLEEFKLRLQECISLCHAINAMVHNKWQEALQTTSWLMNIEGESKRTTPRQIIRILFLKISTIASKYAYEGELQQAIYWVDLLAKNVGFYLKKGDVHYEQIKHNVNYMFYYLENSRSDFLTNDIKNRKEKILNYFQEQIEQPVVYPPPALEKRLELLNKLDKYEWMEGWIEHGYSWQFTKEFSRFKEKMRTWINMYNKLIKTNRVLNDDERLQLENLI